MELVNKNIPKLRFTEFSGEWSKNNVGKLCDFIVPGRNKPKLFIGDIPWITTPDIENYGTVKKSKIGLAISKKEAKRVGSKIVPKDSIIMSCVGELGIVALVNNEIVINQQLHAFIPTERINNRFLLYGLSLRKRYMDKVATITAVPYMNKDNCNSIPIIFPSLPEQQKIAQFLTSIDTKIEQITKKKNLLEQYKKGVMQQIFSQQLRFKDENVNDFPDWEEKKLGEICDCLDNIRKPLNGEDRNKIKGEFPYWGANNIMDYINDYIFDETIVLLAEDGGNFNEFQTRPIANISYGKCWVNNHTHVLRGKKDVLNHEYLYFSLVHKDITAYVSGGTRSKLTKSEMLKIKIKLPSLKEQRKIANFLSTIDIKIDLVNNQLEKTQEFKKGLLQQMFV
jgi:type I restriction enzyme, S subunit